MTDQAATPAAAHGLTPEGATAWMELLSDAITAGYASIGSRRQPVETDAIATALLPIVATLTRDGASAAVRSIQQRAHELAMPLELLDFLTGGADTAATAGPAAMPRDKFQAVLTTSNGSYGVAEDIRCTDCEATISQCGIPEADRWTLARLDQLADRHQCTPRFLDPANGYPGRHKVTGGRVIHATKPSDSGPGHIAPCGAYFGDSPQGTAMAADAAVSCQACVKALVREREGR